MRINARLDDYYELKFHEVQQYTGKNRTQILKEALDQYFETKLNRAEQDALAKNRKILEMIGGIAEGSEDLSENYKDYLYQGLKEKYAIE